eukprot:TRINITY_DN120845_c0_g1_i1.p1 TRINITY_DN120845_c0_g1~~TRINITY_DN120845_c0_g1_i1.p1  ORF type:complete len:465 (-),score=95.07 TRINITY_DN120845_c0_g1_i1:292-1686(-)
MFGFSCPCTSRDEDLALTAVDLKGKLDVSKYYGSPPDAEVAGWCMQQTMIRVKDPKKSLDFYTKVLGMRLLSVGDFPQWGFTVYFVGYVDKMAEAPPADDEDKKFAYSMTVPGCIELTWNHGSESEAAPRVYNTGNSDEVGSQDGKAVKGGFGHIGITVPDVYEACDRFKAAGAEMKKSPNSGGMKGLAFIKDPDGYAVEILPYGKNFPFPTKDVDCNGVKLEGEGGYTGGLANATQTAAEATGAAQASLGGKFDWKPYYSLPEDAAVKGWCSQQTMIRVKDPRKSLDFYCNCLGMRLISCGDFPQWGFTVYFVGYPDEQELGPMPKEDGDRFGYSMKVPGCVELTWNHGSEAETAERIYNTGNADDCGCEDGKAVKGGFGHLGITVPDVYSACERFKKFGCEFKKSPNSGGMKGLAFVKDPDGYAIEVLPFAKSFPFPTKEKDCCDVVLEAGGEYSGGLGGKK